MQTVSYVDQSAERLTLQLMEGHPDRSDLNIIEGRSLDASSVHADLFVIGGSHALLINMRGFEFTELFSCENVSPNGARVLGKLGLKDCKDLVALEMARGCYYFRAFDLPIARFLEPEWFFSRTPEVESSVSFDFPGNGSEVPRTVVKLGWMGDFLEARTIHSYPNEKRVVLTWSTFEFNMEEHHGYTSQGSVYACLNAGDGRRLQFAPERTPIG